MVKSAVEQFIDDHGADAVAAAAGKSTPAIRLWRHRHIVPRTSWPELITGLPGVTMDKLLEIEALSKPFADRHKMARAA